MTWKTHGKSILSLITTLFIIAYAAIQEVRVEGITPSEWVTVVIAAFSTVVVWLAANITGFDKAKTVVGALTLVLNLLVNVITGGISNDEWLFLAVQFVGALGVAAAPATKAVVERKVISV